MDTKKSNPGGNASSDNSKKKAPNSIKWFVEQLAMAFGQVIPGQRIAMYVHALSDLNEKQLAMGFNQALKLFKPEYGKTFPLPGEIREWALQWRYQPDIENTRLLLERGDKPPDWEPMTKDEAKKFIDELRAMTRGK